jgi:hypothetical protein
MDAIPKIRKVSAGTLLPIQFSTGFLREKETRIKEFKQQQAWFILL